MLNCLWRSGHTFYYKRACLNANGQKYHSCDVSLLCNLSSPSSSPGVSSRSSSNCCCWTFCLLWDQITFSTLTLLSEIYVSRFVLKLNLHYIYLVQAFTISLEIWINGVLKVKNLKKLSCNWMFGIIFKKIEIWPFLWELSTQNTKQDMV